MRFLIDNQLPRALAKLLQDLGHHAVHVLDVELARVDEGIWSAENEPKSSLEDVMKRLEERFGWKLN